MQQKKKVCKSCGNEEYLFSRGRCKRCATIEDAKPLNRTPIVKKKYTILKQTEKNKAHRKSQSAIRDVFFEHHIPLCKYSEEDGSPIYEATRANICHLFYKRTYKSVQANLNNFVYLTLEQHTRFDSLLDKNDFKALEKEFKCWSIVVQRMKNLLPEVLEMGKMRMLFEDYLLTID
jgi:hypothetical protein